MKRSARFLSCTAFFMGMTALLVNFYKDLKGISNTSLRNHRHFTLSSYTHRSISPYGINGGKKREFY